MVAGSLLDAKPAEDLILQVLRRDASGQFTKVMQGQLTFKGHHYFTRVTGLCIF